MSSASKVRFNHVPNWLRLAWLRTFKGQRRGFSSTAGWSVAIEIQDLTGRSIDHWGSTDIDGQKCLVSEPYHTMQGCYDTMKKVADAVGGHAYVTRESHYGHGTVRGIVSQNPLPSMSELGGVAALVKAACEMEQADE